MAAEIGATEEEVKSVPFCFFYCCSFFFPVFVCVSPVSGFLLFWFFVYVSSLVLFLPLIFDAPCYGFSSPIYREACPSTSPAFAGLLWNPRTRSWARDVVHDRICCRFSGLRLNRDEEDHMAVPPATTTFRQKVIFSF